MDHVYEKHENCTRDYCNVCEGGLAICTVCGGMEGSLLPECPGKWLDMDEHEKNYEHYCNKTGPFAKEKENETHSPIQES